jgi:hypothetical protein
MSYCQACIRANPINRCADSFYIPIVTGTAGGDYNVILTDVTTGRQTNIDVTAAGNTLTVVLDGVPLELAHTYKVEVFEGGNYNEKREITIGASTACCVEFETTDYEVGTGTNEVLSLDTCE